ncbi:MAG TPA: protein kinase family protein [Motilibacterales bacterium]|nr:protein kinase family protein [Motilibacterales bacterium]
MNERGQVAPNRQIGRFTLDDLVEERYGAQIWRAVDSTLNREVVLWLVPADEALAADLEQSTRTAATVDDRRIVRILDVFTAEDLLVIVTEWSAGEVLGHHLTAPMPPAEAARIAYEVSGAIESAHARGIAHGRLRPLNILVGHDGEVRVTGLGIDAVLAGIDDAAGDDPVAADVHGIGSILYACLTARWPDGDVEGIPGAPEVGGHTPPPSRLLADVPESLDDLCARTVIPVVPPRGRPRLTSAGQAREALGASLTDLTGERRALSGTSPERSGLLPRLAAGLGILLLVLGLAWVGLRLLSRDTPIATPPAPAPTAEASPTPEASAAPEKVTYQIVAGRDFDPLGNGEENPGRVTFAYDGDLNTAWRTVTYYNKSLDKPGVGILLDLGAPRTIGSVSLDLVGNGTDLQVLTSNDAGENPQDYDLMAQATEAGEKVRLKAADPTSARYVLVWLTGLPQVDGGWRGGIREVAVTS